MANKGTSLKDWIAHHGIAVVAGKMGTSCTTIRHWRRGHCLPKSDQMLKIMQLSRGQVSADRMIKDYYSNQK